MHSIQRFVSEIQYLISDHIIKSYFTPNLVNPTLLNLFQSFLLGYRKKTHALFWFLIPLSYAPIYLNGHGTY